MRGQTKPNTAVPAGLNRPDSRVVYQDYNDESHPEEGLISCSPLNDDVLFHGNLTYYLQGNLKTFLAPSAPVVGVPSPTSPQPLSSCLPPTDGKI